MPRNHILPSAAAALALCLAATAAQGFERIDGKDEFMRVVDGKDLRITGIRVNVTRNGEITGRAFGMGVKGEWNWQDGFFCRTLFWGKRDLGQNCQKVSVQGNTIRFQSDRGAGEYADLSIR